MCQQAAEKAIKAVYVEQTGETPPRSLLQNAHRMVVETAVEGEFPVLDRRIWPVWQF